MSRGHKIGFSYDHGNLLVTFEEKLGGENCIRWWWNNLCDYLFGHDNWSEAKVNSN